MEQPCLLGKRNQGERRELSYCNWMFRVINKFLRHREYIVIISVSEREKATEGGQYSVVVR